MPVLPVGADEHGRRRRVRAFPESARDDDGVRLRLGAVAGLADGQHWKRCKQETPDLKRLPSEYMRAACLVHDAADGGAGDRGPPARHHRLDRLGPAAVRDRLSALGLRQSGACLPLPLSRGAAGGACSTTMRRRCSARPERIAGDDHTQRHGRRPAVNTWQVSRSRIAEGAGASKAGAVRLGGDRRDGPAGGSGAIDCAISL